MAQAVKRLYPDAKLAIGPAIDNGFYYDIDVNKRLRPMTWSKLKRNAKIVEESL